MNVSVIGDGAWGTALAMLAHENGHAVTVWGPFPKYISTIKTTQTNPKFLPDARIPAAINWTSNTSEAAANAEVIILAVPSHYFSAVVTSFKGKFPADADIVSVTKGLDEQTYETMTSVAARLLNCRNICALSGPSHAEEVSQKIPTAVTVASADAGRAERIQQLLTNGHFRVYTSKDVIGVEIGGALKNVIALAVGISDGLGFGDNTRAALMTRGLAEIMRLGVALGANPLTFSGLSGMGDLIVTCTSRHSRNRRAGENIGKGMPAADIMANSEQAVEGIWNCKAAEELARQKDLDMPVTSEVVDIVHRNKNPMEAVCSLMNRDPKRE